MVGVKHHTVATKADQAGKEVNKDQWNENHDIDDASIAVAKLSDHTKTTHDALGLDADTVDTQHAADFAAVAHNHNLNDLTEKSHASLSNVTADQHHAETHAVDGAVHTGTLDDDQFEGAAGTQANTPNTSLWNVAGTARKILVYDVASGKPYWDYLVAYEVMNPAQITGFTITPSGAYPEGVSATAMIGGAGGGNTNVTPVFAISYQGTPIACAIDINAETGTPTVEINAADYPATVANPYTALTGPNIYRKTSAVATTVTFRATATVDGQSKTKDVTLTFLNERMYGDSDVDIDTQAEIDTFRGVAASKTLSNSKSMSFSITPANEYVYVIFRTALGTPHFTINGLDGDADMEDNGPVSWLNPRGFTENYSVWKSINLLTGTFAFVVT